MTEFEVWSNRMGFNILKQKYTLQRISTARYKFTSQKEVYLHI